MRGVVCLGLINEDRPSQLIGLVEMVVSQLAEGGRPSGTLRQPPGARGLPCR
jgi:hypothetical protein